MINITINIMIHNIIDTLFFAARLLAEDLAKRRRDALQLELALGLRSPETGPLPVAGIWVLIGGCVVSERCGFSTRLPVFLFLHFSPCRVALELCLPPSAGHRCYHSNEDFLTSSTRRSNRTPSPCRRHRSKWCSRCGGRRRSEVVVFGWQCWSLKVRRCKIRGGEGLSSNLTVRQTKKPLFKNSLNSKSPTALEPFCKDPKPQEAQQKKP